jgi:hypothetical protein
MGHPCLWVSEGVKGFRNDFEDEPTEIGPDCPDPQLGVEQGRRDIGYSAFLHLAAWLPGGVVQPRKLHERCRMLRIKASLARAFLGIRSRPRRCYTRTMAGESFASATCPFEQASGTRVSRFSCCVLWRSGFSSRVRRCSAHVAVRKKKNHEQTSQLLNSRL